MWVSYLDVFCAPSMCLESWRPDEHVRFPGTRVTKGCVLGIKHASPERAALTL